MRIALLVLLAAQALPCQKLLPIDDAPRDPEFQAFTRKLLSVATKRDSKALRKLLDEDVISSSINDKKDEKGWAAFRQQWHPDDPTSDLWETLADFCDLGFVSLHPRLYVSPYVAWKFPRELNPTRALVVTRSNVPLRAKPERDAPVLATLEFDIVYALGEATGPWRQVRTAAGLDGFVLAQNLRSPLTPRGQFARKEGRWVIIALER